MPILSLSRLGFLVHQPKPPFPFYSQCQSPVTGSIASPVPSSSRVQRDDAAKGATRRPSEGNSPATQRRDGEQKLRQAIAHLARVRRSRSHAPRTGGAAPEPLRLEPTNPFEVAVVKQLRYLRCEVDRLHGRFNWLKEVSLVPGASSSAACNGTYSIKLRSRNLWSRYRTFCSCSGARWTRTLGGDSPMDAKMDTILVLGLDIHTISHSENGSFEKRLGRFLLRVSTSFSLHATIQKPLSGLYSWSLG